MVKIHFENIGRNKVSYDKEFKEVNYDNLYSAVKPYLLSSVIWFSCNDEGNEGTVFAEFHSVGSFKITERG